MDNKKLSLALSEIRTMNTATRKVACQNFPLFLVYYLSHYIKSPFADFHFETFKDLEDLQKGNISELLLTFFRESGKTSIFAKAYGTYVACYGLEPYVAIIQENLDNAKLTLMDITLELQTNPLIIQDFGQLYNEERKNEKTEKKIDAFRTTTGVRFVAKSVLDSIRGTSKGSDRPTLIIFDDYETTLTKNSAKITQKIIDSINESRTSVQAGKNKIIHLTNYVSDSGSVQYFTDLLKNYERGRVRRIPILNIFGEPTWGERYSLNGEGGKISIQDLKDKYGENVFQLEYMLEPNAVSPEGAYYREQIDKLISEKRLTNVPHTSQIPVYTWWDLGISDNMVVLFFQRTNTEWRLINYYEVSQKSLEEVIRYVNSLGYNYAKHYAPHDIEVRELSTGKTRKEIAKNLGVNFDVVPKIPTMDGINAVRGKLSELWVDISCEPALSKLKRYREWNGKPLHDETSHIADTFRYWAITSIKSFDIDKIQDIIRKNKNQNKPQTNYR